MKKPKEAEELDKLYNEIKLLRKKVNKLRDLEQVKNYYYQRNSERTLDFVREELNKGNMVWCRNGSVCSDATPCRDFNCEYKDGNDDTADGCSKCHKFQVTTFANYWGEARHINAGWMDNLAVGW